MAVSVYFNRVKYTPTLGGTGDFVTSAAVSGFRTPATGSIPDGSIVSYVAFSSDQSQWETGQGAYTSATTTLARTTVRESSNAGAKVNFTTAPVVALDFQAQDITNLPPIAINGATIGTNGLAVTGTAIISGNMTLGSTALLLWSTDATLSRNAAGIIQFGTTAANAAGSLLATNGTFTGGTLVADNGAAAVSPFIVKDNGTAVFTIADGGSITATSNFVALGLIGVGNNGGFARGFISGTSTTSMVLWDSSASDFGRLQFGGTTSSFPSIGRSTTRLIVQLADGTAGGGINFSTAAVLSMASGTNQRAGNASLVGGTVTVSNTTVTANTVVILTRKTSGGTIGTAITYTLSAGASFTVNSDNILDTSTFSYMLIEVP